MSIDVLAENRSKGWERVPDSCPQWARVHITEWRTAVLEKRSMNPAIVRTFIADCEQHWLAFGRELRKVLAPITSRKMSLAEAKRLSRSTGRSLEDIVYGYSPKISEERWLRMRLESITATVARDAKKLKDEKRNALLADTSPAGKIALREYLDVLCGVRPADPGALPYGFTDLRTEDGGQVSDPQQLLRTWPSYDDGEHVAEDDEDPDEDDCRCHRSAAAGHRSCAQRCSRLDHGSAHHKAADAHIKAAETRTRAASRAARVASYRANHFQFTDKMVS
jgi:hypothetical protein